MYVDKLPSMFKLLYVFLRHTYSAHIFMSSHTGFKSSIIATCSDAARNIEFLFLFFSSKGRPANWACIPCKGAHLRDWFADKSSTNILRGILMMGFPFQSEDVAKKSLFSWKKTNYNFHCNIILKINAVLLTFKLLTSCSKCVVRLTIIIFTDEIEV